jgi:pSer/pThr/pTyr-binding forkhead associated (FHA) protein
MSYDDECVAQCEREGAVLVRISEFESTRTLPERISLQKCGETRAINIGRGGSNTVQLYCPEILISMYHARIEVDSDGNHYIIDCGSDKGTYMNSFRIITSKRYLLVHEHTVSFGAPDLIDETVENPCYFQYLRRELK